MKIITRVFDWRENDNARKFYRKMKKKKLRIFDYGIDTDTWVLVAAKRPLTKKEENSIYGLEDSDNKEIKNEKEFD